MDGESRLGEVLGRSADAVQPDVPTALREVHERARRRTTTRRTVALVAAVGVVAGLAIAAKAVAPGTGRDLAPVSPPHGGSSVRVQVVREVSAPDLGLRKLLSVAVSTDGRVYVTDTSQRVAELTPDLGLVRSWGGSGAGDGRFRLVQGAIAVGPDGKVYVSDTGNFRVQEFSPDGRFLRSVGRFGNGPGQFTLPFDVAVDGESNLYVTDDKEETFAKLTSSGRQIWRHGGLDETDSRWLGHEHISMVDDRGRAIVTNDDQRAVMLVGADGSILETFGAGRFAPGDVCDATVDGAGRYFVTPCAELKPLSVYAADGTSLLRSADLGLAQSPRWGPDGTGYAVTAAGGVVRLAVGNG